jgi:hypothetical protein
MSNEAEEALTRIWKALGVDWNPPSPSEVAAHVERMVAYIEPAGSFGWALRRMRAGERVARAGWNGKGMWVALTPGSTILVGAARAGAAAHLAAEKCAPCPDGDACPEAHDFGPIHSTITIGAHIDMRAADGSLVVGWLASQTDMLATDWSVVN